MADAAMISDDAAHEGGLRALEVLVVEDDEIARTSLCDAICALGHRCRLASSRCEALRLHAAHRADVIISNWNASGLDGTEFHRKVRSLDRSTYTYLLSTSDRDATRREVVAAVRAGADACLVKPIDVDELEAQLVAAGRVVGAYRVLAAQTVGLRRDSQAIFRSARVDALTGVANRLRLEEDVDALQAEVLRYRRQVCVAMCDVDQFKHYNDHFGHVAGDEALRRIAQAISQSLRQADRVYRYGGEEFLVLLSEQTPESALAALDRARRAVEALALPQAPDATSPVVTVSIGLAAITPDRDGSMRGAVPEANSGARCIADSDLSVRAGIVRADRALYRAKADGRNRIAIEPIGSGVYARYAPAQRTAAGAFTMP
ncbi:MAG TPA: diguanylate cyclase [Polyangiaceae bacterium]|nr:diguanylate cyclase [Polyangiaceae bacterium]